MLGQAGTGELCGPLKGSDAEVAQALRHHLIHMLTQPLGHLCAQLLTTGKRQAAPGAINRLMNKMWSIFRIEDYSTMKRMQHTYPCHHVNEL